MLTTGTASTACPCAAETPGDGEPPWLLVMPLRAAEQHVLVVVGEADISTADQLRAQLLAALASTPPAVRVELGGLDFCDLHGLDALHDACQAAAAARVPLTLCGMSDQLTWLHRTFPPVGAHRPSPVPSPATASPTTAAPTTTQATAHRTVATQPYRAGAGRGRPAGPDGFVHAVPVLDTTRSALCGARVRRPQASWDDTHRHACPDCALLLTARPALPAQRHAPALLAKRAPTAGRAAATATALDATAHLHAAAS